MASLFRYPGDYQNLAEERFGRDLAVALAGTFFFKACDFSPQQGYPLVKFGNRQQRQILPYIMNDLASWLFVEN